MKAIILTHPTQGFKACIFGLDYEKLCLLAEFRAKIKKTVKPRFKTIEYKSELDLAQKTESISKYKITLDQYKHEINLFYGL